MSSMAFASQKMIGVILIYVIAVIIIVTVSSYVYIALAQIYTNKTGLGQASPRAPSPVHATNITGPHLIGPSKVNASQITDETKGTATPANTSIPSSRGTFLGTR